MHHPMILVFGGGDGGGESYEEPSRGGMAFIGCKDNETGGK
jgi:hypothetical protein